MFRIIKAFKPRYVIGENVRGIINIQDGVVFETVCTDLESEGYEVQPFIIPAAGVGAPHRRERVWIIATLVNTKHNGSPTSTIEGSSAASSNNNEKGQIKTSEFEGTSESRNSENVADTQSKSSNNFTNSRGDIEIKKERSKTGSTDGGGGREDVSNTDRTRLQRFGSEHELRNSEKEKQTRRIGWWDVEPDVGRVAYGVSGRVHRLKGLGNSIVPQIAEEIGRAIIKAMK